MNRIAKCSCGNLQIELSGDPRFTVTCHCFKCQKRTGSVFGVGAYFEHHQIVRKTGEQKIYNDVSDAGKSIKRAFCPNCGSTVFWDAEFQPNRIGVAVGCFEDPQFPEPISAAWIQSKHSWVTCPSHWKQSETQEFKRNA